MPIGEGLAIVGLAVVDRILGRVLEAHAASLRRGRDTLGVVAHTDAKNWKHFSKNWEWRLNPKLQSQDMFRRAVASRRSTAEDVGVPNMMALR
jgi:hypothetical protein